MKTFFSYLAIFIVSLTFIACGGGSDSSNTPTGGTSPALLIANAGNNQSSVVNTIVTLDATGSTNAASYHWSLDSYPLNGGVTLSDTNISQPTFTPTVLGAYEFTVIVKDVSGVSASDVVIINVTAAPVPGLANAGLDQTVQVNSTVTLNASASTGTGLSYAWSRITSPAAVAVPLTNNTTAQPSFTPTAQGIYTFELTLTDSNSNITTDRVTITVNPITLTANAGTDSNVAATGTIALDGSASTGSSFTYSWNVVSQPQGAAGYLTSATTVSPTLHPNIAGDYTVQLTITDASNVTSTDTVVITGLDRPVSTPTLIRAANQANAIIVGDTINLNGSSSTGLNLTYLWTCVGYPNIGTSSAPTITGATTATPSFVASDVGSYSMSLKVTDSIGQYRFSTLQINVVAVSADAGSDVTIHLGDTWTLDGSASRIDPNAATSTVIWQTTNTPSGVSGGSQAVRNVTVDALIANQNTLTTSLVPTVTGSYTIELHYDNNVITSTDPGSATVIENPIANAGSDITTDVNSPITLYASSSTGVSLTYEWTLTVVPGSGGSPEEVSFNSTLVNPNVTFTSYAAGQYTLTLVVTDHSAAPSKTSSDSMLLTVNNPS